MYDVGTFDAVGDRPYACANFHQDRRFFFSVLLLVHIVFFVSANSSGQDLGALARAEQARKQAQPVHPNHVYTNDDLVRPQILAPEDRSEFDVKRRQSDLAEVETPPVAEPATPEVSLGEVASQYRQQRLARQSPPEPEPSITAHVYTNDDMVRPTILTREDHAVYEAALRKPVPSMQLAAAEPAAGELAAPEAPLGDIARAAYREHERTQQAAAPSKFHFPGNWTALASPIPARRPPAEPPKVVSIVRASAPRHAKRHLDEIKNVRFEAITVRRGDSLWKLARVYLGHGSLWRTLLKANPRIRDPDHIKIGMELRI